jgi:hypothetical protein
MIVHRKTVKKFSGAPPRTPFELDRDQAYEKNATFHKVMEGLSLLLAGFVFFWLWVILP